MEIKNNYTLEPIARWYLAGAILIFLMVVIGGITRLTGSGMSITEWKPITGTIPPLSEATWQQEFEKYKDIPQFKLINYDFTLADFKQIYFWEYFHRLIARVLGLVFIIPFIYFIIYHKIDKVNKRKALSLFLLGGIQGFLGWYMVSSGLSELTKVSHYRLAIHLIMALTTFAFTYWYYLDIKHTKPRAKHKHLSQHLIILLIIVAIQITFGAFVAGLHAGHAAYTWPSINGEWIPESLPFAFQKDGIISLVENPLSLQFIHRSLAYAIALYLGFILLKYAKLESSSAYLIPILYAVMIQIALGVFTLFSKINITLAVLHQAGAFLMLLCIIRALHYYLSTSKTNFKIKI